MVSSKGVYEVQESGLQFKHNVKQQHEPQPTTPQEYLDDFRYVRDDDSATCLKWKDANFSLLVL